MAARFTVYNCIVTPKKLEKCNKKNLELTEDFLDYLKSIDRADTTIRQYRNDLNIFWCWNLEENNNKDFIQITKREFAKMQRHCLEKWGWGSQRVRRFKSTISSLSNYIENILDDEEEYVGYRSSIKKIESPAKAATRIKTVFKMEELQCLLDHLVADGEYMKACVIALCIYSGRRKAEIPRFKVSYFDDENVKFGGAMWKTNEPVKTKGRGKGKFIELYVLRNQFLPYLNLWLEERDRLGIESEWLFPRKERNKWLDEQMHTETMDSWVPEFSRFLGKDFYYHSLRHFFTTMLGDYNIPANVIQAIVGWESADMVTLYQDTDADDSIGKYFDENGIKQVEAGSLSNM